MLAAISILCSFVRMTSLTQLSNHSKLSDFIILLETIKNAIKFCRRFLLHEIKKNIHQKIVVNFMNSALM